MTKRAQAVLNSFARLNETEQGEVVSEIIRKRREAGYPALTDDELTELAEERFLELDRREAAHARTRPRRGMAR